MRILVVEDDYVSRKMLGHMLADYGDVDFASDGNEALLAFENALKLKNPYGLVCLDIMMPGMDGKEVLKKIRLAEEAKGISALDGVRIVMTTALGGYKDVAEAFRDQCDAYLVKPISKPNLDNTLNNLGFKFK